MAIASVSSLFKVLVLNAENLFIFLERWDGRPMEEMTEPLWQLANPNLLDNKPLAKTRDLAATILRIDPDLVLLTEVGGHESLENFNRHFLASRWTPYLLESNSDRGIDMGYLLKSPWRGSLTSFRDHRLKHPRYTHFSRDVLALKIELEGKVFFHSLLVHLKSKLDKNREDFEGRTRRALEVQGLCEIIQSFPADTPLFLGGDFNGDARLTSTEPEFLPLYQQARLIDAAELSELPVEERYSYVHFRAGAQRLVQQLDYLFLNSASQKMLLPHSVIFPRYVSHLGHALPIPAELSQKRQLPSDHFPLYAEFDLTLHPHFFQ